LSSFEKEKNFFEEEKTDTDANSIQSQNLELEEKNAFFKNENRTLSRKIRDMKEENRK